MNRRSSSKRVSFSQEITVKEFLKTKHNTHENSPDLYRAPINNNSADSTDMELTRSDIGSPASSASFDLPDYPNATGGNHGTTGGNHGYDMELTEVINRGEMTMINPHVFDIEKPDMLTDDSNMDISICDVPSSADKTLKLDVTLIKDYSDKKVIDNIMDPVLLPLLAEGGVDDVASVRRSLNNDSLSRRNNRNTGGNHGTTGGNHGTTGGNHGTTGGNPLLLAEGGVDVRRSLRVARRSAENTPPYSNVTATNVSVEQELDEDGSFFKPLTPKRTPIIKVSTTKKRKPKLSASASKSKKSVTHLSDSFANTSMNASLSKANNRSLNNDSVSRRNTGGNHGTTGDNHGNAIINDSLSRRNTRSLTNNESRSTEKHIRETSFMNESESVTKNTFSATTDIHLIENSANYSTFSEITGLLETTLQMERDKEKAAERQKLLDLKAKLLARVEKAKADNVRTLARKEELTAELRHKQETVPSTLSLDLMKIVDNFKPPKFSCEKQEPAKLAETC